MPYMWVLCWKPVFVFCSWRIALLGEGEAHVSVSYGRWHLFRLAYAKQIARWAYIAVMPLCELGMPVMAFQYPPSWAVNVPVPWWIECTYLLLCTRTLIPPKGCCCRLYQNNVVLIFFTCFQLELALSCAVVQKEIFCLMAERMYIF